MRILMLASYFPKPGNLIMGNWALSQAQALARAGLEMLVVSGTSWVPPSIAATPGARAYANCPAAHAWAGLRVMYPRWLLYSVGPLRRLYRSNPEPQMCVGWYSIRRELLKIVAEFKPDLIYAHHTSVNGFIAARLKQLTGIPYVITDHDLGEINDCDKYPKRLEFYRRIVSGSSCMVAVAARMERDLRTLFPQATVATVHNGTDFPPTEILRERPIDETAHPLIVFTACALYERKGIPLLVRAFAKVSSRYPYARLRIAGDGPDRKAVEQAILATGIASHIDLLGQLPHDRILKEMVSSDIFALPGWDEPFATAFSEALSVGRPIIYSLDGGISDVVTDGVEGLGIQPRSEESLVNALDSLLSSAGRRTLMGAAGARLVSDSLLWDHNAQRMKDIFQNAVLSRELPL